MAAGFKMQDTFTALQLPSGTHTPPFAGHPDVGGPHSTPVLDGRSAQIYHDILHPHGDQLHKQLVLRLVNHKNVFASTLEIVLQRRPVAHADFQRRLRTKAIPSDSCDFFACLAGSIITCSRDDVLENDAYVVSDALVSRQPFENEIKLKASYD